MESKVIAKRKVQAKRKKIKLKKYYIKDVGSQMYEIGLCRQRIDEESCRNESASHRNLRNFVSIVLILLLVKHCFLLIYYNNQEVDLIDEKMFLWFGDLFFFDPQIRKHFNAILMFTAIHLLHTQML